MTHTPPKVVRRPDEFRGYSPSARDGILHIRFLSDEEILAAARSRQSDAFGRIRQVMPDANPFWISARCAEEAYDRDLIDERELDRLSE